MSRLRDERGMTLTEMLVVVGIFMIVLTATLTVLEGFASRSRTNQHQNDTQEQARRTMDRLTRQLRNLAKPTLNSVSIDKATDYDLIFQTADPQKRRVRYCLNSANTDNATLWLQTQAFADPSGDPAIPSSTACPAPTSATGWASQQVVGEHVTNRKDGGDRDIFYYSGLTGDGDTAKITAIRAEIFVDLDVDDRPGEVVLASGVFLRNQNQRPVADFTPTWTGGRNYVLNASDSSDPEGRTLDFFWYRGSGNTANLPSCLTEATQTGGGFTCIGRGLTVTYKFPPELTGDQQVHLKVIDPGDLTDIDTQTVTLGS